MTVVGARVTVFIDGDPVAGAIMEVGLATVRIGWSGAPPAWFHDLGSDRKPGALMGDPLNRIRYVLRDPPPA